MAMTYDKIMAELKKKIYRPIYFLSGEEPYYIDLIADYIAENVLSESEKAFNQITLYGKDTAIEEVDNAARRFPMMASHQVIIVKEAQDLKKIEHLVFYAQKPLQSTLLVLCYKYKKLAKNKKVYKAFDKNGAVFESKKLYDNKIPDWINTYLKQKKYSIDIIASRLLTDFLGNSLSKISNELEKLIISLPENTKITPQHIEENIGISKDFNNFELQNALRTKNILKANQIINYFAQNPRDNPLVLTISSLYYFYVKILSYHFVPNKDSRNVASVLKINPYFVKDYEIAAKKYNKRKTVQIISLLREYDMKSKGVGNAMTSHGDLLKELIFKILH